MATIRKRNGKYQVQVRIQGCAPTSRTFTKLEDAKSWARLTEIEAEQTGLPADPRLLSRTTVADVLERYRDEVIPKKRGHEIETIIVNAMLRQPEAPPSPSFRSHYGHNEHGKGACNPRRTKVPSGS